MRKNTFIIFILSGLLIRALFSLFSFHVGDLASWLSLGSSIYVYGISPFIWWSQGPFGAIPLMLFQFINYLGFEKSAILSFTHHLPFIFGDVLLLSVIYMIIKKYFFENRYLYTLIIWFNSLFIFVSSIKGQSEQWMAIFTFLSFYLIANNKNKLGFFTLGCAISFKYIPILIVPFIIFLVKDKASYVKGILLMSIPIILGFLSLHFLNVILFNDYNFFTYFLDRSGTIFGNFTPDLAGQVFISTGSSIWGQIVRLGIVSSNVINPIKNIWLVWYMIIYLLIFSACLIRKDFILKKFNISIDKFFFLSSIYSCLYFIFLWLYPQTTDNRFLFFVIALFLISFYLKFNPNYVSILSSIIVFGNFIYSKNGLFYLLDKNLSTEFYTAIILSILILSFIFSVKNGKDLFISILFLLNFGLLYLMNNSRLHELILFTGYVIPFVLVIYVLENILKKKNDEGQ